MATKFRNAKTSITFALIKWSTSQTISEVEQVRSDILKGSFELLFFYREL